MTAGMLGVITNDPHPVFQGSVIAGVEAVGRSYGYGVQVFMVEPNLPDAAPLLAQITDVKGMVVIANTLSDHALHQLAARGIAISLVSHQSDQYPSITPNNRQGIALLMEHLIVHCGRRLPLFICGDMAQTDGIEREAAFQQEVMRYNLATVHRIDGHFSARRAADALRNFLEQEHPFDCILAADYLMALAALDVLKEKGWRIPQEIAVVGFGDGTEAAQADLTTVAADIVELGRRGARQLLRQMQGVQIRGRTLLSATLVVRGSTVVHTGEVYEHS
jgi:DNA-binding LacI/PurR family transcriptional regulator